MSRALLMDREVARAVEIRLRNAYEAVLLVIGRNRPSLDGLVEGLLVGGTLSRHDIESVLAGRLRHGAVGGDMPVAVPMDQLSGEP